MSDCESVCRLLGYEAVQIKQNLKNIKAELEELEDRYPSNCSIVIKKIKGKLYYYMQWRQQGRIHWKCLGRVKPGSVSREERRILRCRSLHAEKEKQERLLLQIEQFISDFELEEKQVNIVENYSFEVFWKDEITARVVVKGSRVQVSRYTEHPVKQLFFGSRMSRDQLNRVFESRCWDRNRADIAGILAHLGLTEYHPYAIVRKTHGVSYNDHIWFRFPGESLTSEDVLVR